MLTTGLEGGNRTTSAASIASSTPGAGAEPGRPVSDRCPRRARSACSRTHHSWKCTVRGPGAASGRIRTTTGSRPGRRHREQRHARLPALAQRRGGGRQRLARRQHAGPGDVRGEVLVAQAEPVRARRRRRPVRARTVNVSPARPQPCSSLIPPPRVYITVSRSGETCRPNRVMSSPVLPMTVIVGVRGLGLQPAQEAGSPDSAGEHGDAHAGQSCNPGSGRCREPPGEARPAERRPGTQDSDPDFPRHQGQEHRLYHVSSLT